MDNKELFYALARDGECWHEPILPSRNPIIETCKHCGDTWRTINNPNPDFSAPDWNTFGWAWKRAKEKEWWSEFKNKYLSNWKNATWAYDTNYGYQLAANKVIEIIDPALLINALREFLEGRKKKND